MSHISPADLAEISDYCGQKFAEVDLNTLPSQNRAWAEKFTARGYVFVTDQNESEVWLRPQDKSFLLGYPHSEGIELHLWDDFFNGFQRKDFNTDEEYLDEVEKRYAELWARYDEA